MGASRGEGRSWCVGKWSSSPLASRSLSLSFLLQFAHCVHPVFPTFVWFLLLPMSRCLFSLSFSRFPFFLYLCLSFSDSFSPSISVPLCTTLFLSDCLSLCVSASTSLRSGSLSVSGSLTLSLSWGNLTWQEEGFGAPGLRCVRSPLGI